MEPTTFQSLKLAIIAASQLSRDALHVYVGLGTFLAAAFLFRRSIRSYLPLVAVLVVAMLVEAVDLRDDLVTRGHMRWLASAHDLVNTLFWPTILLLLARHTRWFGGGDDPKGGRGD
jgi:cell shape-determining protein MreD